MFVCESGREISRKSVECVTGQNKFCARGEYQKSWEKVGENARKNAKEMKNWRDRNYECVCVCVCLRVCVSVCLYESVCLYVCACV